MREIEHIPLSYTFRGRQTPQVDLRSWLILGRADFDAQPTSCVRGRWVGDTSFTVYLFSRCSRSLSPS